MQLNLRIQSAQGASRNDLLAYENEAKRRKVSNAKKRKATKGVKKKEEKNAKLAKNAEKKGPAKVSRAP